MKKIKAFLKDRTIEIIGCSLMIVAVVGCYLIGPNTRTINGTYSNGTIVTTDNNVWKVTNYNGISTKGNHKVSVKFDTKGTDSVLDDEIVEIKEAN